MLLEKYEHNPILSSTKNIWENKAVFNCGATLYKNKVYLLYRAMGEDNVSRLGLAISKDGYTIDKRFPNPLYEPQLEFEQKGIEDPRITKINDTYHIVYSGFWDIVKNENRTRVILTKTKDFRNFSFFGVMLPGENNKDGALFSKKFRDNYILIHRRFPNIWIANSKNMIDWFNHRVLLRPRKGKWDSERIGVGPPPLKTKEGWLLIYHGVDKCCTYRLGAVLLDLKNPAIVLKRYDKPIVEPTESWEKKGLVNNVIFSCGLVEIRNKYLLYYGGADKYIGVATIDKKELLENLK